MPREPPEFLSSGVILASPVLRLDLGFRAEHSSCCLLGTLLCHTDCCGCRVHRLACCSSGVLTGILMGSVPAGTQRGLLKVSSCAEAEPGVEPKTFVLEAEPQP